MAGVPARCESAGHISKHAGDEMLVTTIHQAKGREGDVVVVGSLGSPNLKMDLVGRNLAEYSRPYPREPMERIGDFDRARRHYVAFIRACTLACDSPPAGQVQSIWKGTTAHWPYFDRESLARQRFGTPGIQSAVPVLEIDRLDRLVVSLMKSKLVE